MSVSFLCSCPIPCVLVRRLFEGVVRLRTGMITRRRVVAFWGRGYVICLVPAVRSSIFGITTGGDDVDIGTKGHRDQGRRAGARRRAAFAGVFAAGPRDAGGEGVGPVLAVGDHHLVHTHRPFRVGARVFAGRTDLGYQTIWRDIGARAGDRALPEKRRGNRPQIGSARPSADVDLLPSLQCLAAVAVAAVRRGGVNRNYLSSSWAADRVVVMRATFAVMILGVLLMSALGALVFMFYLLGVGG